MQTNSSLCIDLILTDQTNLSMNTRAHAYLHLNCHRQTVHFSFNLISATNPDITDKSGIKNKLIQLTYEKHMIQ